MSSWGDPETPFDRHQSSPKPVWRRGERLGRAWPVRLLGWLFVVGCLGLGGLFSIGVIVALNPPEPPCGDDGDYGCLEVDAAVGTVFRDTGACSGSERQVCLIPLGATSLEIIGGIVGHYREAYDLEVAVLPPLAIDRHLVDLQRQQVSVEDLSDAVLTAYGNQASRGSLLIGVTPADLYIAGYARWRYAFGSSSWTVAPSGDLLLAAGMVSTFRMGDNGDERELSRALKMTTKYIGAFYYDLPLSDDPESAMYNHILGPADLDRMGDRLDLPAGR
jgi:hypothetical protein